MSRSRHRAFFCRTDPPTEPPRACDMPGCPGHGQFRAPKARTSLNQYYWFCLEHVRAYNAAWDYYAGMKPEEIEEDIRRSVTWDRPTWPLGRGCPRAVGRAWTARHDIGLQDDFGFFEADATASGHRRRAASLAEERALSVLDLTYPMTLADLKARYKLLVKRHHPDANGGDKAAEEKLKIINEAYTTLRAALTA